MIRWLVWSFYVIAWTIALEVPIVVPVGMPGGEVIITNRMLFAKTAHVAVYVGLSVLSAWLPLPSRFRPVLMFLVMGHATATELLQEILEPYCHRGGSLADAALDHLGIAIGLLLTWRSWTRGDNPPAPIVP